MSRSRKKSPVIKDYSRNYTRWAKRQASKRVRRYTHMISNGGLYKKIFPSWDIKDYSIHAWDIFDKWHDEFKNRSK